MRGRRGALWLLGGIALALLGGRWFAGLYADWAFLRALGADAVWRDALVTGTTLRTAIFAIVFAFAFLNLFSVRQSIVSLAVPRSVGGVDFTEAIPTDRLTLLAVGGALLLATLFALVDQDWTIARMAFAGVRFGEFDPYLERDLAFYVQWLPFERLWYRLLSVLVLLVTLIVVGLYAATPSVRWDAQGLYVSTWVRRHLGVLGGIAVALISWDWRLDRFSLLTEGGTATTLFEPSEAFTAFDHRVLLPYLAIISFAALPVALLFAWSVWRGLLRTGFALVLGLLVAGPVMRLLLPALVGGDAAEAAVAVRERPYGATRALFSRRAFGVDLIVSPETLRVGVVGARAMSAGAMSARAMSARVMSARVSSWDPAALARALTFERRGTNVRAVAWQGGLGGLEVVLLRGAREDAPPGSPWPLDRLLPWMTDERGAPLGVPGRALEMRIAGILVEPDAGRYLVIADTTGRLAAPAFETTFQRVALAWAEQDPRLLFAEPLTVRPRLMVHRAVRDRVSRLAPFLATGPTVTPVVRGDSLYWTVELFSVAREYPLADRVTFDGMRARYVRHAATAVVQAQTGQIVLYSTADPDPVLRGWAVRFPALFRDRSGMPEWLATALPPLVDYALVQGAALGRAGFSGDTLGARTLARVDDADVDLAIGPLSFFQLDSLGTLAWGMAVVDGTDQVNGLLVARGGRDARTEFHRVMAGPRWAEVLERLQASADSAGFGRALAHSRRGRVQVVPTSAGIAFVQAFYDWPAEEAPRLAGVAILADGRTRVGRTLADALGTREVDSTPTAGNPGSLQARAAALYDTMEAARRAGDWRRYGEAWEALGRMLGRR